jgi:hypothetical protein
LEEPAAFIFSLTCSDDGDGGSPKMLVAIYQTTWFHWEENEWKNRLITLFFILHIYIVLTTN